MLRRILFTLAAAIVLCGSAHAQFVQPTPSRLQASINAVSWTNGLNQVTGAQVRQQFQAVHDLIASLGTWDANGVFKPYIAPGSIPTSALASGVIPAPLAYAPLDPGKNLADVAAPAVALTNLGGQPNLGYVPLAPNGSGAGLTGLTPAQIGAQPTLGFAPLNKAGDTMTGGLSFLPASNSKVSFRLGDLTFASSGPNPGFGNPVGPSAVGADTSTRAWAPGYDEWAGGATGLLAAEQLYVHSPAASPGSPYGATYGRRAYALLGQEATKSGSFALDFLNANIYSGYNNGPGNTFNCTATQGSAVLSNCTLASDSSKNPSSINPATGAPYLFAPTVVSGGALGSDLKYPDGSVFAEGIPLKTADSSTMTMTTPGTNDDQNVPYVYPGATGTIQIKAVSGISEINLLSHHIYALGATPGVAHYNELNTNCSKSVKYSDVDSFCNGLLIDGVKNAPGNSHDITHHGSALEVVQTIGTPNVFDTLVSITGFGGPGAYGGADANGNLGALEGLSIGGGCLSPYCTYDMRSWIRTGAHIQDYDIAAITIDHPMTAHGTFSGNAITSATGAGNWRLGDNLYIGTNSFVTGYQQAGFYIENLSTPSSSSASCTAGQFTDDINYHYVCTAANHWRRVALSDF